MPTHRTHSASASPLAWPARKTPRGLLTSLLLCLLHLPVHADVALYQALVPLKGTTEADRKAGFAEALAVAAVRASGRSEAAIDPRIISAAADASRYVQQYSTTTDRMLKVGFDGRAMEQLLQQAGLPLWPAERPATTVLLFAASVADGSRAVGLAERPPERAAIDRAALARGVPLAWPAELVDVASARSRAATAGPTDAVLVGVAGPAGFEWTFGHAGRTARGQGSVADGLNLVANTLAARYAPPSTRGTTSTNVRVGGVGDIRAYAALTQYLQDLSLVRAVSVVELTGDAVLLRVTLRGDAEILRRIVALDSTHLQSTSVVSTDATNTRAATDYTWQP